MNIHWIFQRFLLVFWCYYFFRLSVHLVISLPKFSGTYAQMLGMNVPTGWRKYFRCFCSNKNGGEKRMNFNWIKSQFM